MNYDETLQYLYNLERFGIKLDLTNITSILNGLGNPHLSFPSVHVAGTNGKGSVAAMLQSILRESGYKTGLYTSPHLVDFRERIRVGREMIEKRFIQNFVHGLKQEIDREHYTFFEVTTALAFDYFSRSQVDLAIVETGLGGRLDATNMIKPVISIISNIGREHTKQLGNAITQIAREKAGIIKPGVPTITAVDQPEALQEINSVCSERSSELIHVRDASTYTLSDSSVDGSRFAFSMNSLEYQALELNLPGEHQVLNAVTALTAIEKMRQLGWKVEEPAIRRGLRKVDWRARLEVFHRKPLVLLDVAHNPAGIKAMVEALDRLFPERQVVFVFGVMQDKDHASMLHEVSRKAKFLVLTKADYKRSAEPESLKDAVEKEGIPYQIVPQVKQAYLFALQRAEADDIICVTGSHFTVGELLGTSQNV